MKKNKIISKLSIKSEVKTKIKKILPGSIATLAILIIVAVTVFQSADGFSSAINTEPAKIITEKDYMSFTSYILKDEKVVTSKYSGGVYHLADNAQRVNPGDELAKVYENDLNESSAKRYAEIDKCIAILEKSIDDGIFTLGESNEVQARLSQLYYDMARAVVNGDSSVISSGADDFLILLNKIIIYSGKGDGLKSLLEDYKKQRAELESEYSGDFEVLNTSEGGYFFRETDGYEGIYTSADIKNLTYESFVNMTEQEPSDQKYAGKLLVDYRWYLVIPTVKGVSDTYSVGTYYDISFTDSNNRAFEMELDRVVLDSTGSRSLMVFACGIVDGDFDYLRVQQVNITHRNISGYRVPASAVCEIGGNTGVYILKDGMASFRKVVILYEGEGYYIVLSQSINNDGYYVYLESNDNIITDCKNMYEGKVIGG